MYQQGAGPHARARVEVSKIEILLTVSLRAISQECCEAWKSLLGASCPHLKKIGNEVGIRGRD